MVESDHRQLEMIFKKPLCECSLRLLRMRLVLQMFPISVTYKPGKELFLADALSRFPSKVQLQEETEQFEVNAVSFMPIADDQLRSIWESTKNDALMSQLLCYTKTDWPETRLQVPDALRAFWAYRVRSAASEQQVNHPASQAPGSLPLTMRSRWRTRENEGKGPTGDVLA